MTAGWTGSHMDAGDAAWRAWRRLGVNPWEHMLIEADPPAIVEDLASVVAPEVDRIARLVLDELEVRLYGEARERVVRRAHLDVVGHVTWAIKDAIATELMRPDPVPFSPPPTGSWIRGRWPAREAAGRHGPREARWDGLWHLFAGDLSTRPLLVNDIVAWARCGARVNLRFGTAEAVIVADMPGVDACRRCRRGPSVPRSNTACSIRDAS